jgi:hypothetical protein
MPELPSYARRVRAKAHSETTRFIQHKLLTGVCVAISVIIVRLALWHFHRLTLTWAEVWITLLTIVGSYGIVVAGAFIVNLFRAPVLLDNERAGEIRALAQRLKETEKETDVAQQKIQTAVGFATIFQDGKRIEEQIITNQNAHDFSAVSEQINPWAERGRQALIECGLPADASIFIHSGERPSDERMKSLPFYLRNQTWKHYDLARLTIYLEKLQEIMERRNL